MAITRRSLQYQFLNYKTGELGRLKALLALDMVTEKMSEMIPLEFWLKALDQMNDCPHCMLRLAREMGMEETSEQMS